MIAGPVHSCPGPCGPMRGAGLLAGPADRTLAW